MTVRFLPALDSDLLAETNRSSLHIDRLVAQQLGSETLNCCKAGAYTGRTGNRIEIGDAVSHACDTKISIRPDDDLPTPAAAHEEMRIQVANETTTVAAQLLQRSCQRVLALNFANGVEPGGGWLRGARAQEETLCRISGLYATLVGDEMYQHHLSRTDKASTAWSILSPHVPFFRAADGTLLDDPWFLDVLSSAAPVANSMPRLEAARLLNQRILRVLAIAQAYQYDGLVLGAWGCGAFGNDPRITAEAFRAALAGPFARAFQDVRFAIADWSDERRFLGPFRDVFFARNSGQRVCDLLAATELLAIVGSYEQEFDEPLTLEFLARLREAQVLSDTDWRQLIRYLQDAMNYLNRPRAAGGDGSVNPDENPRSADWIKIVHARRVTGYQMPAWATLWLWWISNADDDSPLWNGVRRTAEEMRFETFQ